MITFTVAINFVNKYLMKYNRLQINNTYNDVYYQVLLRIR